MLRSPFKVSGDAGNDIVFGLLTAPKTHEGLVTQERLLRRDWDGLAQTTRAAFVSIPRRARPVAYVVSPQQISFFLVTP
jgi:hypothetical protein